MEDTVYARAERLLEHNRAGLAFRTTVTPHWIAEGDTFWYTVNTDRGIEFVHVDPEAGSRRAAFDHQRLAASLAEASGSRVDPYRLPFHSIDLRGDTVRFEAFGTHWSCSLAEYACSRTSDLVVRTSLGSPSPDGKWVAFVRDHNLWLRAVKTGTERALTQDGFAEYGYATDPDSARPHHLMRKVGLSGVRPALLWSSDSSKILSHRTDERGVATMTLVESSPPEGGRPRSHSHRYALPGEPRPHGEWIVFDIHSQTSTKADAEPFLFPYESPLAYGRAWWSASRAVIYYVDQPRDMRTLRLNVLDAVTGDTRTLIEETGSTRVDSAQVFSQPPIVRVMSDDREALWYSQRDNWGHLYLYDLDSGKVIRHVTKGEYCVQEILHVDEDERVAYIVVSGLVDGDPYRRSLVSVGLDAGEPTRLSNDDLDHIVAAPKHGRWFVDVASLPDTPPVTTVRGRDGAVILTLERADIGRLVQAGWTAPERTRTIAADGKTFIYGLLYKPSGFDPADRYAVLDHVYPGPQISRVKPSFDQGPMGYEAESLAALGFVVLAVDGRGTPGRDKAFHDHAYRNIGSCGLEDHVAALQQLGQTRPWMNLDAVGIFGRSGGGFATARALLEFPETFHVGVAEAGNHDMRYYHATWAETYDGPFDPGAGARLSNTELADKLAGRLLLVHGEMDDNVTPHLTMRLVDGLIAADKDFELLIVPGAEHSFAGYEHYVIRRRWDYFVRHLLNREPPTYRLAPIPIAPRLIDELANP